MRAAHLEAPLGRRSRTGVRMKRFLECGGATPLWMCGCFLFAVVPKPKIQSGGLPPHSKNPKIPKPRPARLRGGYLTPTDCNLSRVTGTDTAAGKQRGNRSQRVSMSAVSVLSVMSVNAQPRPLSRQAARHLALANSGQKRSRVRQGSACFGSGGRTGTDRDGHGRTKPCCSAPLVRQDRQ